MRYKVAMLDQDAAGEVDWSSLHIVKAFQTKEEAIRWMTDKISSAWSGRDFILVCLFELILN